MSRSADLHLHTIHSDGIRTPREVIDLAWKHAITIVGISDHDDVAAFGEIREYATGRGMTLVPAVELSCVYRGTDIHVLAYAFDPTNARLLSRLESFRETRDRRGDIMVEKLNALGYDITIARVRELAGSGSLGRPHVARALVECGAVGSVQEAFEKLLTPGMPAYVDKQRFDIPEAVELIRATGGLTSIAHPTLYPEHRTIVPELLDAGLDGIEVAHPDVTLADRKYYTRLARAQGKMVTGGSDDHGFERRETIGTVKVPEEWLGPILERCP